MQGIAEFLTAHSEDLEDEVMILLSAGKDITLAQVSRLLKISLEVTGRELDKLSAELSVDEQRLRDRLRLIAEATDEEGDQ